MENDTSKESSNDTNTVTEDVAPEAETRATTSTEGSARADALAQALSEEKAYRQDERFLFVFAIIVLLNVIVFDAVGGWLVPIILVILELVFLVVLARLMGVEEVVDLAQRLGRWARHVFELTVRAVQGLRKPKVKTG